MFDFDIEGKLRKSIPEDTVRDFLDFCVEELKLNRFKYVEVHVKFSRLKDAAGWCTWEDDNIRPREFTIDCLNTQTDEDIFKTLAHEMVHVKQMLKGESKELFKPAYRKLWKGEDHTNTIYEEQPWEKEAYALQDVLYDRYHEECEV